MTQDNAINRLIMRLLLRDGRLSSRLVHVTVQDGCVRLQGRVRTATERNAAVELASTLPGVCAILNELEVVAPSVLADSTVAENVRRALESDVRVGKESIMVFVCDGVVTLSGTVRTEEERRVARDIVQGTDGVRATHDLVLVNMIDRVEDASIARSVNQAIVEAIQDTASVIRVAVSRGSAVLSGRASSEALKHLAEAVAQEFAFSSLRNEIQVGTAVDTPAKMDLNASASAERPNSERY